MDAPEIVPAVPVAAAGSPASLGSLALLRLLHLASPALPVGAFAYSQGLESAVAAGLVTDEHSAAQWILGLLAGPFGHLDLPVLGRVRRGFATGDLGEARRWSAFLLASRATGELQAEDRQLGTSLCRILETMGVADAESFLPPPAGATSEATTRPTSDALWPLTFTGMFALAAARFGLDARPAAEALAFAWAGAQTSAAVRLVPLGQTAGVRILAAATVDIPAVVARALALPDDEIGAAAPAQALLSSSHETEYVRLFRS